MAKLSFNKLGLKVNSDIKTVEYGNDLTIEVKQYLPVNDKLKLMGEVLTAAMDQNNFANPVKRDVFTALAIIEYYTNITFTEKQKEDPTKLYDALCSADLLEVITSNIPDKELKELYAGIDGIIIAYYQYTNSILGILDNIKQNYSAQEMDISKLLAEINDEKSFDVLKQIAPVMVGLTQ